MSNLIDYGNQSQAGANPGASMLGAMLGDLGTDPNMRPAAIKGSRDGAAVAETLAKGRDQLARTLGREAWAHQADADGFPELGSAIRASGENTTADTYMQALARARAMRASHPGMTDFNADLAAVDGKPVKITDVTANGDLAYNPYLPMPGSAAPTMSSAMGLGTPAPAPTAPDSTSAMVRAMFGPSATTPNNAAPIPSAATSSAPGTASMSDVFGVPSPQFSPDSMPGVMMLTPLGAANIREKNASAADHTAAAAEHGAQGRAADALAAGRTPGAPIYDARVDALHQRAHGTGKGSAALDAAIATAMDPNGAQSPNPSPLGAVGDIANGLMSFFGGAHAPSAQPGPTHAAATPPPGARQARDGQYYVPDPTRPGKYLQWTPQGHASGDAFAKARAAIAAGADPAKVKARLSAAGYDPSGL